MLKLMTTTATVPSTFPSPLKAPLSSPHASAANDLVEPQLMSLNDIYAEAFIGKGSFSRVYKVRCGGEHSTPARAMKCLDPKLVGKCPITHDIATKDIEYESNLLRKLDHPNIVKLYGVSSSPQSSSATAAKPAASRLSSKSSSNDRNVIGHYLVLELLNDSLDERIKRWRFQHQREQQRKRLLLESFNNSRRSTRSMIALISPLRQKSPIRRVLSLGRGISPGARSNTPACPASNASALQQVLLPLSPPFAHEDAAAPTPSTSQPIEFRSKSLDLMASLSSSTSSSACSDSTKLTLTPAPALVTGDRLSLSCRTTRSRPMAAVTDRLSSSYRSTISSTCDDDRSNDSYDSEPTSDERTDRQQLDRVQQVLPGLVSAMMYLHEQDLVYRDIKPQNVGFTSKSSDKVKLYDFGLCRQTSECSDDEIAGTFRYMAPERMVFRRKALIRKSSSDISVILDPAASDDDNEERASMLSRQKSDLLKAADVYSIGVLMWEVATLEQPYQDLLSQKKMMRSDLYMKLGSQGWRHSTEQISCVPLRELIEQCWHVDPTKRPTMTEISKTLNEILSSTL